MFLAALDDTSTPPRATANSSPKSTSWEREKIALDQRAQNNFYRDGGLSDPGLPMSRSGPWMPASSLTAAEADQMVMKRLSENLKVVGTSNADVENVKAVGNRFEPPFLPGTQIFGLEATQAEKFVRVYVTVAGPSRQAGAWVMRAEDVVGLSPLQIASKFSLPQVPTMITEVTIPAGTRLSASVANGVSPGASRGHYTGGNGGGGGVQFEIIDRPVDPKEFAKWFTRPTSLQ